MEGGMRERKASLCRVEEGDEPAKAGGTAQTSRASGFLATEACTPRGVATHLGKHWLNEPSTITRKAGNSNPGNDTIDSRFRVQGSWCVRTRNAEPARCARNVEP